MKKVLFFALLISYCVSSAQKTGTISGKVSDLQNNDEPILFANISLKNTGFSAQSNLHGNFELKDVVAGEYILVISSLGYENFETKVVVEAGTQSSVKADLKTLSLNTSALLLSEAKETTSAESEMKLPLLEN